MAQENGFVGTLAEWLKSLKGADGLPGKDGANGRDGVDGKDGRDGIDGKDGVTPDMSEYPKKSDVEKLIEMQIAPILESGHNHENKNILDATTASYTTEEQQKLADFSPSDYATKESLDQESLSIREAMIPLTRELHSHENKEILEALTSELLADLQGLQQFEDSTKYDIQTIRESVEPVISQAHWHHNLTILNSITAAKMTEWDSISTLKTQVNGLSTNLTVYRDKSEKNAANISDMQDVLLELQQQINALKNNGYTVLFECGSDAIEKYNNVLGFMLNGGFRTMMNMCEQYPNFCCEANDYALSYKGKQFEFPVYFDVEEKKQFDLGKEKISAIMRAFLEKVEAAGYFVGLYGSASSLKTHTADDIKNRYSIWLAHWAETTNYDGAYALWQYSEKGSVSGISGNVDLDICSKDFPAIMKAKGLNGFGGTVVTPDISAADTKRDDIVTVSVQIGEDNYKGTLEKV